MNAASQASTPRAATEKPRATMMGAAYSLVSPYMPMSHALTREHLFAEYSLDWELGSPPDEP